MNIIGTQHKKFIKYQKRQTGNVNTGAYFYAKEIEENILPALGELDITVVTTGAVLFRAHEIPDYSVVVCHDNRRPIHKYETLLGKNILWICSKPSTVEKMQNHGEGAVYIPLSIDTEYVKQFKTEKTGEIAYVGNAWSFKRKYLSLLPKDIVQLNGMEREDLLREMAKYKRVIAEGRCLMEAQVLGAVGEVPQYEDGIESVFVTPLDNRETIQYWKQALEYWANIEKETE